jgi:nucleoid DNA-binding protein
MPKAPKEEVGAKRGNARKIKNSLSRRDVVEIIERRLKAPYTISEVVDATVDALSRLLRTAKGEQRIELRGLGVFEVKYLKAQAIIKDPRTGKLLDYEGRRRKVHFRPSKLIKKSLMKAV